MISRRRMPLVQGDARGAAPPLDTQGVFSPEGARAGWLLLHGAWNAAHQAAQDLHTPEGSYWHAIAHRQEPDAWNSGYWVRRVGRHPVHDQVRRRAAELGYPDWSPEAFIEYCEAARQRPGSAEEQLALEVQHAEWEALFAWCMRKEAAV